MGGDAMALNFLKKLDSTDCSMWVWHDGFLVFGNIKNERVFRFAFIQTTIFFRKIKRNFNKN